MSALDAVRAIGAITFPGRTEIFAQQLCLVIEEVPMKQRGDVIGASQMAQLASGREQSEARFKEMHMRVLTARQFLAIAFQPTALCGGEIAVDKIERFIDPPGKARLTGHLGEPSQALNDKSVIIEIAAIVGDCTIGPQAMHPAGFSVGRPGQCMKPIGSVDGDREARVARYQAKFGGMGIDIDLAHLSAAAQVSTGVGPAVEMQLLPEQTEIAVEADVEPDGEGIVTHPGEVIG